MSRFYLQRGLPEVTAIAPAYDTGVWEITSVANRQMMDVFKVGSTLGVRTGAVGNGSDPHDQLFIQHQSRPIDAASAALIVTGGGTCKGQALAQEGASTLNVRMQINIRVYRPSTNTFIGTMLAPDANALSSEFVAGTLTNRKNPLAALSPRTLAAVAGCAAGDIIVCESGIRQHSTLTSGLCTIRYGDAAATDLPEDETDTTIDKNPWVELSYNIGFQEGGLLMLGVG